MPPIIVPVIIHNLSSGHQDFCLNYLRSYDAKNATQKEMISYSECVQHIYPKDKYLGLVDMFFIIFIGASAIMMGVLLFSIIKDTFFDNR